MPIKGFQEFKKRFGTLADKLVDAMDNSAKDAAYLAVREMKKNLKEEKSIYTGRLWDSIQAERFRPMLWAVGSNAKYMWYVEYGTRPHRPPLKPIWEWVRLKNKMYGEKGAQRAYPIARAVQAIIEQKGTQPHPFIRPAYEKVQQEIKKIAMKHLSKLKR